MEITKRDIDGGKAFDWGKASDDYARYRDIYPEQFYKLLTDRGLCIKGQKVLDIGTGTGVIPRNMYRFGAAWTGADISAEQIAQAKRLSKGTDIDYIVSTAEGLDLPAESFDVITACQCYWYFDHKVTAEVFARLLRPNGKLVLLLMDWLPFEDELAGKTEELVLKYNPDWSGAGETFKPLSVPEEYGSRFEKTDSGEFRLPVHFSRESWNGRIKACRGIGASSLSEEMKAAWEKEHIKLLESQPEEFDILHIASFAVLTKR